MPASSRLKNTLPALRELGPRRVSLYALYRLGLHSGALRRATDADRIQAALTPQACLLNPILELPAPEALQRFAQSNASGKSGTNFAEADEIVAGQVRIFGGPPQPLLLDAPQPLAHWTAYEIGRASLPEKDIKYFWEPARFSWVFLLGRAYRTSGDERYPQAFWEQAERFFSTNPPYLGVNWISAQEVALRLIAFIFAADIFAASPHSTPQRRLRLGRAIAMHAARIPPSLVYARSLNNNHLLSEAAALYTAALALPAHPNAARWRRVGLHLFSLGLIQQIAADGSYVQHSTNYHRLMLQLALWMAWLERSSPEALENKVRKRLAQAAGWLLALVDPEGGRVPNLGPNDGAYIIPLASNPFHDYRPVLQAACLAFRRTLAFPDGPYDEMAIWFLGDQAVRAAGRFDRPVSPCVMQNAAKRTWSYLRVARYRERPGHADQLHFDLWWRGLNLARDAGTYLYNAPPPWDNALARTALHNTLTLEGQDQMTRAGRFLWLNWAQAEIVNREPCPNSGERLTAQHDGYRRLGVLHRRSVEQLTDQWIVRDSLVPLQGAAPVRSLLSVLHWNLPDWPWEIEDGTLRVRSPYGWVRLAYRSEPEAAQVGLARAGQALIGAERVPVTWGWYSPTYGYKEPALAFFLALSGPLPLLFETCWEFPQD